MTGHRGGAGNFAVNPQRAADAGRKGGQVSGRTSETIRRALLKQAVKAA